MARYIDATHLPNFEIILSNGKNYLLLPFEHLSDIPAADVVEVVRCKDCKHWMKDVAGCSDFVGRCKWANYMVGATGYCVYGEKALKEREKE